jgi:segregation and condensation protein A
MYRVNLDIFEGPFDLLLYLIRKNEVDINDIPIATITNEYVAMLDAMREVDISVAGEFLVMAAQLLLIKSRMLLPPDPAAPGEAPEEDPRAELVRQLLEYQRFKQAAYELQRREFEQRDVFSRYEASEAGWDGDNPTDLAEAPLEVNLFDLLKAFEKVLASLPKEVVATLEREEVPTVQKMNEILDLLESQESLSFFELFAGASTRVVAVSIFLAMLELTRLKSIRLIQMQGFGEIRITKRRDEAPAAPSQDGGAASQTEPDPSEVPVGDR